MVAKNETDATADKLTDEGTVDESETSDGAVGGISADEQLDETTAETEMEACEPIDKTVSKPGGLYHSSRCRC